MIQEDKELLLKDLCARLPYKVKILDIPANVVGNLSVVSTTDIIEYEAVNEQDDNWSQTLYNIKPYLFPLSSMTKEQKKEIENLRWNFDNFEIHNVSECLGTYKEYVAHSDCFNLIDWLNKNHFDYRGLILKGLANDATGLNIY